MKSTWIGAIALSLALVYPAVAQSSGGSGYDIELYFPNATNTQVTAVGETVTASVRINPNALGSGTCSGQVLSPGQCQSFGFTVTWDTAVLEFLSSSTGSGYPATWASPVVSATVPGRLTFGAFDDAVSMSSAGDVATISWTVIDQTTVRSAAIALSNVSFGDSNGLNVCGAFDGAGDTDTADDYWDQQYDGLFLSTFDRNYGGSANDFFSDIKALDDGSFFAAGMVSSFGPGGTNGWLLHRDRNGQFSWAALIGGSADDQVNGLGTTTNNEVLTAGQSGSFGNGGLAAWLAKFSSAGSKLFSLSYGGTEDDAFFATAEMANGDLLAAGQTSSWGNGVGLANGWLLRLDSDGIRVWGSIKGGTEDDSYLDVIATTDGGAMAVGYRESFAANRDGWVVKLNGLGQVQWSRGYGGGQFVEWHAVREIANSEYLLAGRNNAGAWIYRTDSTGNPLDAAWIGGGVSREFRDLVVLTDGSIIAVGISSDGEENGWAVGLDSNLDVQWERSYGLGSGNERILGADESPGSGLLLAGWTSTSGAGGQDAWALRRDSIGRQ